MIYYVFCTLSIASFSVGYVIDRTILILIVNYILLMCSHSSFRTAQMFDVLNLHVKHPLWWKCIKIRKSTKMSKMLFIKVWRKIAFDICFIGFGTALTTILSILFQFCYKYCYSDIRNLWAVMKAGGLTL